MTLLYDDSYPRHVLAFAGRVTPGTWTWDGQLPDAASVGDGEAGRPPAGPLVLSGLDSTGTDVTAALLAAMSAPGDVVLVAASTTYVWQATGPAVDGGGHITVPGDWDNASAVPPSGATLAVAVGAAPFSTPPPPPPPPPAPTGAWLKADIVEWLAAHGVTLDADAQTALTKGEMLTLVDDLLDGDADQAAADLATFLGS